MFTNKKSYGCSVYKKRFPVKGYLNSHHRTGTDKNLMFVKYARENSYRNITIYSLIFSSENFILAKNKLFQRKVT